MYSFYKIDGDYIDRTLSKMNARSMIALLKLSKEVKTPLGRWTVNNPRETSLKIKYATEDKCRVSCIAQDKKYIYMMGYESAHN
jgi:hypothetical protein